MKLAFWVIRLLLIGLFIAFLAYFLPSRDIVQIVGTDVKRMDVGKRPWAWDKPDSGTKGEPTRDVRFIYAKWPDGKPRVYRNEDTGWGFPPYFKFDSADLAAKAEGMASHEGDNWVAISHYGWRIPVFSIYPNAYKIKRVSGTNALLIPWFNIIFLSLLALFLAYSWLAWRNFRKKRIEPIGEKIEDIVEDAEAEIAQKTGFVKRFLARFKK